MTDQNLAPSRPTIVAALALTAVLGGLCQCGPAADLDDGEPDDAPPRAGPASAGAPSVEAAAAALGVRAGAAPADGVLAPADPPEPPAPGTSPSELPICPDCQARGAVALSRDAAGRITRFHLRVFTARTPLEALVGLSTPFTGHELTIVQTATGLDVAHLPLTGLSTSAWRASDGARLYPNGVSAAGLSPALRTPSAFTGGAYRFEVSLLCPSVRGGRVRMPVPRGF